MICMISTLLFSETKIMSCTKRYWWWATKYGIYEFDTKITLNKGDYEIRSSSGNYKFKLENSISVMCIELKCHHNYKYVVFHPSSIHEKSRIHNMEADDAVLYKIK